MTDFGTLTIDKVIMHSVPGGIRDASGADPIEYSEAEIALSAEDKNFIQLRLRGTLAGRARPVVEDEALGSSTPAIVRGLATGGGDLVADSTTLARELHSHQKRMSPVGLVMVALGKVDAEACVIVAKMEHEEGMRVERINQDGKLTYKAEHLRDLILGEGTQVFKVGVFKASGAQGDSKLSGEVVDVQQGGAGVAAYFVEFLGCAFTRRSDVMTEDFFKATHRFMSRAAKGDPEKTASYEIALLSEMQSGARQVVPSTFAQNHLAPDDRDAYLAHITSLGLPLRGFRKDTSLIATKIRRLKVQTQRGATVFVPPDMYSDGSLTVEDSGEGQSTVTLTDRITGMTGASGPKS